MGDLFGAEDRGQRHARARAQTVKALGSAASVAVHVVGLEPLAGAPKGDGGDGMARFSCPLACAPGRASVVLASVEGAAWRCGCGRHSGDSIGLVQTAMGDDFKGACARIEAKAGVLDGAGARRFEAAAGFDLFSQGS